MLKYFICPDGEKIEIKECLKDKGCRIKERCAMRPYLRLVSQQRTWAGVTPSCAGKGPRMICLEATNDYAADPTQRAFMLHGTSVHEKLSLHDFNVLAEEKLSDDLIKGIADLLEEDEYNPGKYILSDFKTYGSYKVAKSIGITIKKTQVPILENGEPVLLKSGKNKGKPKTKTHSERIVDPSVIDLKAEELQLNRYRIMFEAKGFPVSEMFIQAIVRDGNTYIAEGRGVDRWVYVIPVKFLPDKEVLEYYSRLQDEVDKAFKTGIARKCNEMESWGGTKCQPKWCNVFKYCEEYAEGLCGSDG